MSRKHCGSRGCSEDGERGLGLDVVVLVLFVELCQLVNVKVEVLLHGRAVRILSLGARNWSPDYKSDLCLLREHVCNERERDSKNRLVVVVAAAAVVVATAEAAVVVVVVPA